MNRTLEELKACDFEELTYGEFSEHGLECKEHCPLFGEFCNGGMSCHGGVPIEPPCCDFEPDTVLIDKLSRCQDLQTAFEKREDDKLKREEEKKQKNAEIAQKRFAYKMRNLKELREIRVLEKSIIRDKRLISLAKCFISATNGVNKMFRESGADCPPDIKPSPKLDEMENAIPWQEKKIAELKAIIKQNEIKFKSTAPKEGK